MKHELLLEADCTPEKFLSLLYREYPYDIEEKMVYSLLENDPYPHPALLTFLSYYANVPKYRIETNDQEDLLTLCTKMSKLYQQNKSTLHLHVFQFDAVLQIKPYKMKSPYAHLCLSKIPFLSAINLHTLPILSMDQSYHPAKMIKSNYFLYKDISMDASAYYAVSVLIGDKHGIVYIPKTQIGIAIAVSILYEVVTPSTEIDFILLYGLSTQNETYAYYFDETNQIFTGLISGECYHHFLYVMQMITTLYNAICLEKKDLPIQACLLELAFDKTTFRMVIMGEDQRSKNALCDAIQTLCRQQHISCSCIFENCGILHYLDNDISATGMQIGACVPIADLPKERLLQMLPSCAFLKYQDDLTHILFPFTSWKQTCYFYKVNAFCYLHRQNIKNGYRTIHQLEEAKQLFIKDPDSALDHLACQQQKEQINELMDHYLTIMMINEMEIEELSFPYAIRVKHLRELLKKWISHPR